MKKGGREERNEREEGRPEEEKKEDPGRIRGDRAVTNATHTFSGNSHKNNSGASSVPGTLCETGCYIAGKFSWCVPASAFLM